MQVRRELLALPPEERIERLLAASRPADLVRALPAQEFFLTLARAGSAEVPALLRLASAPQVEFVFDLDAWQRDEFDPLAAGRWIVALHDADPDAVARFLREIDEPLVVLALRRLVAVYKADESTDPAYWPPEDRELSTTDGIYFAEPREGVPEDAFLALWDGLVRLRAREPRIVEALLEQALWALPAELEDEAFEHRRSRLAERGFPDLDEAIGVWAVSAVPLPALVEKVRGLPPAPAPGGAAATSPVVATAALPPGTNALVRAASALGAERAERLLADLVRLGNRYAVAALEPLGDPATHRSGLVAAASHVNLALEALGDDAPRALAGLDVFELNRAGTGMVLARHARATALARGWIARVPRGRPRLDGALSEILEGLVRPRPLYAVAGESRPFRALVDLQVVDRALDTLLSIGRFLEVRLASCPEGLAPFAGTLPGRADPDDIEWSAIVLTALAQVALGRAVNARRVAAALSPGDATRALDRLLAPAPVPRRVSAAFDDLVVSMGLEGARAFLAGRLEDETGELPPGVPIDPRALRALVVANSGAS